MVENDSIGWYVAKTYRQERKIKDLLARMGIEHFVPFHQVVKEINGKRKKVEEPFVNGLIFVRGNKKSCIELINEYGYPMRYLRDFSTRSLLRVPDKQMEDFIYLVDRHENKFSRRTTTRRWPAMRINSPSIPAKVPATTRTRSPRFKSWGNNSISFS